MSVTVSPERSETYLHLQLTPDTPAVLPMGSRGSNSHLPREVLTVPSGKLTPLPNTPPWTIGLLNQRSRVYWVADLPNFLGLTPPNENERERSIVIVQSRGKSIGLSVLQVSGILRIDPDSIRSPVGTVGGDIEPYLRGCVARANRLLLILDPAAIVRGIEERLRHDRAY